ncbi:MAG TPA: nicotinate-nucleotide--dimethylbenzimidazole phosphoribosyltransferase [Tenuifilaceae bacterium]|nr:nicotinate-nucleotide--dimethylbenzimidazole phosphoribosyltransferase [Tenuifilaceae bacterium]HPI45630.1 nicotinate-nucleotide--dimethylbenzimidazole phosphoribosyltransferase [Tenuifilaceae bacterium]HPN22306.1 nicotinate-nucleotide--dimethylbenzimidazole phosphoribosyltransferase [Tenuifilaceae bacterium]
MREQLQKKIDLKTKPTGSLGQLEDIAMQVGLIQKTLSPSINKPTIIVFAADHGIADEGVSPYPKEVTWQMVMNFVAGGAGINVFCRKNGINLKVVDSGVDYVFPSGIPVVNAKISNGSRNMRKEPAMTIAECEAAIQKGRELIQLEHAAGCNTIGFGEMGIGNTSPAALIMHRVMKLPIEDCVGAGAGMIGPALQHKLNILKEVSEKYNPTSPLETLATFGGLEIAMMVGAYLEASKLGMMILVDGFITTSALLIACEMNADVRNHCIFCHYSNEQGHAKMLNFFKADPILKLRLRLGEGTGAALALPIIESAIVFLNEMASFEDAGVSNKE